MANYDSARARERMVQQQLRARGILDRRVLEVMAAIPRELFVSEAMAAQAYQDSPLPIGEGQTISQPYIVALMTEALHLDGDETVLEIGTGSGYQAAVLSRLAARVYTVERLPTLTRRARDILERLGCHNVIVRQGDGTLGWREFAPYDGILVTAFGPDVPPVLVDQLAIGGRLVMPVGSQGIQELVVLEKTKDAVERSTLGGVRFVPLVGRFGWERPRNNRN